MTDSPTIGLPAGVSSNLTVHRKSHIWRPGPYRMSQNITGILLEIVVIKGENIGFYRSDKPVQKY